MGATALLNQKKRLRSNPELTIRQANALREMERHKRHRGDVLRLHRMGRSQREIAEALCVHRGIVRHILQNWGPSK